MRVIVTAFCITFLALLTDSSSVDDGLLVMTVATEANDGFNRFMRSANLYNLDVKVLGMGQKWKGGDVAKYAGGGQKVKLLKEGLDEYKDRDDLLVMFVDSYDLVFTEGTEAILSAFKKFDAKVVFSAEDFCWPEPSLAKSYPEVTMNEKRYLNSGGFMGVASYLYKVVSSSDVKDNDDDQLFYTKIFLDEKLRTEWNIKLDNRGEIFQNLNGALDDVKLKFKGSSSFLYNMRIGTRPIVVHGNGPIKPQFNRLAQYLADQWTPSDGCRSCFENTFSLKTFKVEDYPAVLVGLFLPYPTPFAADFLENIVSLNYPKSKMHIFIYHADKYHDREVNNFLKMHSSKYRSVKQVAPEDGLTEAEARNKALEVCELKGCQYYFSVDGEIQIEKEDLLRTLIEKNRTIIVPMFVRHKKSWSNFWGALSENGYYRRSDDYLEILKRDKKGQWNVPYMTQIYLIHAPRIPALKGGFSDPNSDPDMAFCKRIREKGMFMLLDNTDYYGHMTDSENYQTTYLHNDLYEIMSNQYTWEKKYIHPEYQKAVNPYSENPQPCPDVYHFPIVTPAYCSQLIEEFEHYGKWSGGKNDDPRLPGGYENVPTVDIHMNQVGMERQWLYFLRHYVAPLTSKVFLGYFPDSRATMNFMVRYKPKEQDHLRPHHDASTFTINIALNRVGIDYEGGGVRFTRYNCSVLNTTLGYMLMHPGRLTHQHEGLTTTKGTRYIMISFVDP